MPSDFILVDENGHKIPQIFIGLWFQQLEADPQETTRKDTSTLTTSNRYRASVGPQQDVRRVAPRAARIRIASNSDIMTSGAVNPFSAELF